MEDVKLPPLPEPYKRKHERGEGLHDESDTFTADQMQAYARQAVLAERERIAAEWAEERSRQKSELEHSEHIRMWMDGLRSEAIRSKK